MKKRTRILFTSILVVLFAVTSYLIKDFTEMYKLYGEDLFRQSDYEETEHFLTLYSEQINGILTQVNHKLADGSKGERVPRGFNNLAYQVTVGDMVFTNVTKQEETGCFTPNLYSYYSYQSDSQIVVTSRDQLRYWKPVTSLRDFENNRNYEFVIKTSLPSGIVYPDRFSSEKEAYNKAYNRKIPVAVGAGGGVIFCLVLFFVLLYDARKSRSWKSCPHWLDLQALLLVLGCVFLRTLSEFGQGVWKNIWDDAATLFIFYTVLRTIFCLCSLNSENPLRRNLFVLELTRRMPELYRWMLLLALALLCNIAFPLLAASGAPAAGVLLALLDAVLLAWLGIRLTQYHRITKAVHRMAAGETKVKIERPGHAFRLLAEDIEHIGEGLSAAVEEQVKSERLKADLITNVSHDLKTPLTSMISYIGLLRREPIEGKKAREYLEILDAKAEKLRALTENLVRLSKLTSGNETCELARRDFGELLRQTDGEFAEAFERRKLELRSRIPSQPVPVLIDGEKMWRVLDNLYQNALKYALEGTRVYVNLETDAGEAVFKLMNISAAELNISPDELMERFVRGDHARTTEGSGLGLSIARSLVELQGGVFELETRGDLFQVTIRLPLVEERKGAEE